MKYLKSRVEFIKEAFESLNISKTLAFLKSNVSKDTGRFLEELKRITEIYDYPLSKVKDENIKYLSKIQALKIKSKPDVKNSFGVDCIKYWFSIEEGYLGYTAIGNKTYEYKESINTSGTNFTKHEIDYLTDNLPSNIKINPREGKFVPIISKDDYLKLKTGDIVAGYLNSYEDEDDFTWATIFKENSKIYAIQNIKDGALPDNDDWDQYGDYSWAIYLDGNIESDHGKLHKFVIQKEDEMDIDQPPSNNPLSWNLPLRGGQIRSWSSDYNSIRDEFQIDKSDFCLVLELDDMMNPDMAEFYERPSDMRKERGESREGATALMSDEDIKNTNISRYISQMIGRLGISPESNEFKDLNKLVLKFFSGRYTIIRLLKKQFSRLEKINDHLYDMIQQSELSEKQYHFDIITTYYERTLNYMTQSGSDYRETEDIMIKTIKEDIDEPEKTLLLDQWNQCIKLSELITSLIQKQNITTIEDLRILTHKLDSLSTLLQNDRSIRLESRFLGILKDFDDHHEVDRLIGRITEKELINNQVRLINVEKAIRSVLS
jgi:hypothetical protein